jgi:hypothetical protein
MFLTRRRSLRVLAHLGDDPVERHRVAHHVVSQVLQLERLVVEDGRARRQRHHVLAAVSGFMATRKSTSFLRPT